MTTSSLLTTDAILTRMQLNHTEITGIARAFKLAPTKPIQPGDLPCIYMLQPRGMVEPVARNRDGGGVYVVKRRFEGRVLVGRSTAASFDTGDEGSYLLGLCLPFLDRLVDYWMLHPRMSTDAGLGELSLAEDITYQDTNVVPNLSGPDGQQYAGISFVITVADRRFPNPARLS